MTGQGISLLYDRYSYNRRLQGFQFSACALFFKHIAPGRRQSLYIRLFLLQRPNFLLKSRHLLFCVTEIGSPCSKGKETFCRVPSSWFTQDLSLVDSSTSVGLRYGIAAQCYVVDFTAA
jgi:hypothetical protein